MQILGIISENGANFSAPNKPTYTRPKIIDILCRGPNLIHPGSCNKAQSRFSFLFLNLIRTLSIYNYTHH